MQKIYLLLSLLFASLGIFVQAQDPCNLVEIMDVRYDAFRDTLLLVEVTNNSSDIFSYPGFILYDANGDTIAKEGVNFFGIGQEHISEMRIYPDALIAADTFHGTLELWTGFYSTLACTFDISEPLCPETDCQDLVFDLANIGGALVAANYIYTIINDQGVVQATQAFYLEDTIQHYSDTLCLPNGAYTLQVQTEDNPTGGQPHIILYELISFYWGTHVGGPIDQASDTTSISFELYANCLGIINDTQEPSSKIPLDFRWSQEGVWATAQEGQVRELILYDLTGRQVAVRRGPAEGLFLPAGDLRGLFIAHCVLDTGERLSEKVYFE